MTPVEASEAPVVNQEAEDPAGPETPPEEKKKPFELRPKAQVRLGHRTGHVKTVRGNRGIPYEVEIRFDGEKYPQWFQYRTLRLHWEKGVFTIL